MLTYSVAFAEEDVSVRTISAPIVGTVDVFLIIACVIVPGKDAGLFKKSISSVFEIRTVNNKFLDQCLKRSSVCFVIGSCSCSYRRKDCGGRHRNYHRHNKDGRDNFFAHGLFSSFKFCLFPRLLKINFRLFWLDSGVKPSREDNIPVSRLLPWAYYITFSEKNQPLFVIFFNNRCNLYVCTIFLVFSF